MPLEQPIDTPIVQNTPFDDDPCSDPQWIQDQQDRLLGYEILMKAITADPTPMSPGEMSDRIGLNKGFSYGVLTDVVKRMNHG